MSDHSPAFPDEYDRLLGALDGLPEVSRTKPTTIDVIPTLGVGGTWTFILHTVRQRDQGDTIFLRAVGSGGQSFRLVLPQAVTEAISRQRDALTTKSRKRGAQAAVQTRKERGIQPGFMKNPNWRGRKKKKGTKKGGD